MDQSSRRVPEVAIVVGLVLAFPAGLFVALFEGDPLAALALALVLFYPFVAYSVAASPDPTTVLVPRYVLAAGAGGAALTALVGLALGRVAAGLAVGLFVAVPAVAYHTRYGPRVNPLPPRRTLALGGSVAALVLLAGLATDAGVVGAVGTLLALLGSADYHGRRGGRFDRRTERLVVGGCLGGAILAIVGAVVAGQATVGVVVGFGLIAVGVVLARRGDARNETLS
ncbi:hypothetical protein [Halomarina ordinaria]|uniref:DUF92 domain-containing protein n=1 Tax=Halomarina ordinaria TaxID=3033939 RepID=A0ABD5UFN0_9EURY|nr:hypothetical protein [Halomarina sp. PSRA2]